MFDPREFRLLDGLRLNPRKSFGGKVRGERLTQKKGVSIEFADYREYTEGDDLRHLDWNVLARLETPVMRTYRDEEDLAVHLLLDGSASMGFGDPTKFSCATRLACALGYIGLISGDAIMPRLLGRREPKRPTLRGRANYPKLLGWAQQPREIETATVGLTASLKEFSSASLRTGLVVLLSDGLDPEAAGAIRVLGGRGHEVFFLQVLNQSELEPDIEGDLRLLDSETAHATEITANSSVLKEYKRRLADHNAGLVEVVYRVGGRYALVRAEQPFENVLQNVFKREGWVK